jgi:pantothenate kinase
VTEVLELSPDGSELPALLEGVVARTTGGRRLLGLVGQPGAGKSTLAGLLGSLLEERSAVVPLDGFHLADVELARLGLIGRKGAPETFDAWGYAALLERLLERSEHPVYAPAFERTLEQPLAGAIAVGPEVELVVTEGNYLLLDRPEWVAARSHLDQVWHVVTDQRLRQERLVQRHVTFGKGAIAAADWVARVDEPNARLVEESPELADLVIDLTRWSAPTG